MLTLIYNDYFPNVQALPVVLTKVFTLKWSEVQYKKHLSKSTIADLRKNKWLNYSNENTFGSSNPA